MKRHSKKTVYHNGKFRNCKFKVPRWLQYYYYSLLLLYRYSLLINEVITEAHAVRGSKISELLNNYFVLVSLKRAAFKCILKQSNRWGAVVAPQMQRKIVPCHRPQYENPMSLNVFLFVIGTMNCPAKADLRCARPGTSANSNTSSG